MASGRNALVVLVSAKGGIGKSLLAVNLGACLSMHLHLNTLVVDINAGAGIDDVLLDLRPDKNLGHLMPVLDEVAPQHLELAWASHPSGVHLLSAPPEFDGLAMLDSQRTISLVNAIRRACELAIVDCPTGLNAINREFLTHADRVLCLVTSDTPCLRATQRMIAAMEDLPAADLIISQYEAAAVLTPLEISEILKRPVIGLLPVDGRAVWENVHFGLPCALGRKRGLGGEYRRLAHVIVEGLEQGTSPAER